MPNEPGVISAMATMSVSSDEVSHPCASISARTSGIIDWPPKLEKPTRM